MSINFFKLTPHVLFQGRCIICGAPGISDAYYCRECTLQEKDVSELVYFYFCILY
jgi:hypothetical protein